MRGFLHGAADWLTMILTSKIAILAIGGATGTNARYWLGKWVGEVVNARGFPLGTFIINVSGSFVLGAAAVIFMDRLPPVHRDWFLLIGTGFCGGFTTFSTFELETFQLVRDGSLWMAFANVAGSVAVGFLGVVFAIALTGLILPKH